MSTPNVIPTKKPAQEDQYGAHFVHNWMLEHLPALYMLMSVAQAEGLPRPAASLRLFVDQGRLKGVLNDPGSEQAAFVTLPGDCNPLEVINECIQDGTVDWRPDNRGKRR